MSFLTLILKNLFRQRMRTGLTTLGISIGITTVIALGVIVDGLMTSAGQILTTAGSDFMVGQRGSADLTFSTVTEDEVAAIAARPDVERAIGTLITISRVGDNPFFVAIGIDPLDLQTVPLGLLAGDRCDPRGDARRIRREEPEPRRR
jgi:putative ABC transport system permease protein